MTVLHRLREGAGEVRDSTAVQRLARVGLVARGAFYLVIAYLAARVAALHGSARQANTHGALELIEISWVGKVMIALAAAGLFAFGVARLVAGWLDRGSPALRRATTMLQGAFYLVLTYVPVSFLEGDQQTGSEHQQHASTAKVLGFPGGRELVVAIGVIVVAASVWQIRTALTNDWADTMRLQGLSRRLKRAVLVAGTVGITARALVFLPIGVFLAVAAIQYDPSHAKGLDGELLLLSKHTWGEVVIAVTAAGLTAFAVYSFLEARYRDVRAGE
jgi:hypothetical protein